MSYTEASGKMGCTKKGKSSVFSDLELKKVENESIVDVNVLFWNSGKSLIVASGSSCLLYSVPTGEQVKKLFTCSSKIVSCHFHPNKKDFLVALTEEGDIVKYDLDSDVLKRTVKLKLNAALLTKQNIYKIDEDKKKHEWNNEILSDVKARKFSYGVPLIVKNFNNWLYWTSWSLNDETQCHVTVFFPQHGAQIEKVNLPKLPLKKCYKNFVICQSSDKNVLYIGMGVKHVEVYHYTNGLMTAVHHVHHVGNDLELTCLALLPKEFSFVTADTKGVILLWKNILKSQPLKTSCLWHTVSINDVAFSGEGVHLYSGGDENVLVKWSFLSNQKNFLPRLASPIRRISIGEDSSLIAVSLANNEINIIDSNFQKISVIKKFAIFDPSDVKRCNHVLTVDPRSDNLVLNATTGHLQFIAAQNTFKVLYMLDVGGANYMTGDKYLVNLTVTHAKFNRTGSLLVTAEERRDEFLMEYRLKFWQYNETKQCFFLNTSLELPHDENDINALEISSDDLVATSGSDKQFKLWAQFEANDLHLTKTVWSVLSVGKYKLLPAGPIDFCEDATLIAVGFGPSLTLWNTSTCTLKCSLVEPFKRDNLKFLKFGKEEHSHLIVTATDYKITTWNIITLTMSWTVDLQVSHLVGDFFNSYMCAFSKSGTLFVFSPGSTSPEFVMENVTSSEVVAAHSAFYVNNEASPFRLFFINSKNELFYLKSKEEAKDEEVTYVTDSHVTPFSAQVAQKSGAGVTKSVVEYVPTKSRKDSHYISSLLDAPAHTLQNPLRFCSDFLESLTVAVQIPTKSSEKEPTKNEDVIEIVDCSDNDDVIVIVDSNDNKEVSNDELEVLLWKIVNKFF